MATIASIFDRSITSVTSAELDGVKLIRSRAFANCSSLKTINFPSTVKWIGYGAFRNCSALTTLNLNSLPDEVLIQGGQYISDNPFIGTKWLTNQKAKFGETLVTSDDGRILISNKMDFSTIDEFVIPDGITSLVPGCCDQPNGLGSPTVTKIVIPDTVRSIGHACFGRTNDTTTHYIIGSSVGIIDGCLVDNSNVEVIVFKQPAGFYVKLPPAGGGDDATARSTMGMAYDKNSRAVSIYTDNEYIRNYDWEKDNVTPTFYPLSEAPI